MGPIMTIAYGDTKAAFDLGSGKFRVLVADVNGKNVQIKYSQGIDVLLGHDLSVSSDQSLSEATQKTALDALKNLKQKAEEYGATKFQGAATAAFRLAKNGQAFLDVLKQETGVDLQIISQQEEGILGFRTAMAFFPTLNEQKTIFWDSGSASFQLVAKNGNGYEVYEGPFGTSQLAKFFVEEVKKETYTKRSVISGITLAERDQFIKILQDKISPPDWLISKLSEEETIKVIALGGETSIFAIPAKHFDTSSYSKEQVRELIQEISTADPVLLGTVCFIYSVMDKCNIHEITFSKKTGGNALGLLLSAEFAEPV